MIDIDTCEWSHPGSNRSTVSIEQAAPKIAPPATAAKLIAAFNAKRYDDLVEVKSTAIRGERDYEPGVRNMNFGAGGLCRKITRFTWADNETQTAMVFVVDGRTFAYFSVCGNLAELDSRERTKAPPAATQPVADPGSFVAGVAPVVEPLVSVPEVSVGSEPVLAGAYPAPQRSIEVWWVPTPIPGVPIAPVPEPPTWALMLLAGLGVAIKQARRRRLL